MSCNQTAGSSTCDGPNVTLFIHIASFTKNDEKYDLFYTYDFIHEKLTKKWIISYMKLHLKRVTSGPSHFIYIISYMKNVTSGPSLSCMKFYI